MCTVAVAFQVFPGIAWAVAANRDELRHRPAERARLRETRRGLTWLGPLDRQAGGTWIGANAAGVLVAITNRFGADRAPDRRSRGDLVLTALEAGSAAEAAEALARRPPREANPHHLIIVDALEAHLLVDDGETHRHERLTAGWHVLTERSFMGPVPERAARVRMGLADLEKPDPARLHALLKFHAEDRTASSCVHFDEFDYGTRATTIATWPTSDLDEPTWLEGEGPACTSTLDDLSALARALRARRAPLA